MYGYRFSHVDPLQLNIEKEKIKPELKVFACRRKQFDHIPWAPVAVSLPIHFNFALPKPCPNYPPNVVIALLKRSGTKPPKSSTIILAAIEQFVQSFCEQHFSPLESKDLDFDAWVEQINQSRARKDELIKEWYSNPEGCPLLDAKLAEIKSFIKDEHYEALKAPRAINARADWFKCYCGPFFDAVSKQVFAMEYFIKTVPVLERPDDIMNELYDLVSKVLNMDATSYECHFTEEVMNAIEFVLYRYMGSGNDRVRERVEKILKVLEGTQNLSFKDISARVNATRQSGEMNTSLGNGFTTVMLNLFIAWIRNTLIRLRAEGDDNLSIWQILGLAPTKEDWEEMGWLMKVEEPSSVCEASFCGNVFDPLDKVVVTDPRPALANFGWAGKRYVNANRATRLQLLKSKGLSMAHQYNGCPLLGAFGRRVVELTNHIRVSQRIVNNMCQYEREEYRLAVKDNLPEYKTPPDNTRDLVERLYNISVEDQIAFEEGVKSIELDCELDFSFIMPNLWRDFPEEHVEDVGKPWIPTFPQEEIRLRTFIQSFGETTAGFCRDYYGRC